MVDAQTDKPKNNFYKTRELVLTALLFAISIVLVIVEGSFPPLFVAAPGIKLGLSNIVVMYALFFSGKSQAFSIAVLKAVLVFATRGMAAGILSLSGGILSLLIMLVILCIFKETVSYMILSVFGAIFHNIGQLAAVSLIYKGMYFWVYLPVLMIAGAVAGIATSTLLRFVLPAFRRLKQN